MPNIMLIWNSQRVEVKEVQNQYSKNAFMNIAYEMRKILIYV